MKKHTLILLYILLIGAYTVHANNDFCNTKNKTIHQGESLTYKVFYKLSAAWIGAGEAVFTTQLATMFDKPVYYIKGVGRTYSSYDWIFKVRDVYETYIDTAKLYPLRFKRDVKEGSHSFTNDVTFYPDIKKAVSKGSTFNTPACVQDVLSAIYYARNIDYSKYTSGDKIPFSMFLDDQVYDLYIRYMGKTKIKTKYGSFNALKIQPLLIEGTIFKGGEKMIVYVSDDKNHVPIRVESPILVGSVIVDLMQYSNLKYPLSSLIKKS
jgi:hypothetical protein